MSFIQEYIIIFTALMLVLGWWVHNWTVLSRLTRIKGRRIGLKWFIRNRPYKLKISAVSSIASGFIAFIFFAPESIDLTNQEGRQSMAIYMSTLFGIGMGADFIVDQVGTNSKSKRPALDDDELDDGKSLIVSEEERAKIIEEMKNAKDRE